MLQGLWYHSVRAAYYSQPVFCASIGGTATHPYAISKHGIVGLCKNLAAELGQYGTRVNCILPSGVATSIISGPTIEEFEASMAAMANLKGKILRVDDVAKTTLYLASDAAGYISGLNLVVDGGYSVVNPTMMKDMGLLK